MPNKERQPFLETDPYKNSHKDHIKKEKTKQRMRMSRERVRKVRKLDPNASMDQIINAIGNDQVEKTITKIRNKEKDENKEVSASEVIAFIIYGYEEYRKRDNEGHRKKRRFKKLNTDKDAYKAAKTLLSLRYNQPKGAKTRPETTIYTETLRHEPPLKRQQTGEDETDGGGVGEATNLRTKFGVPVNMGNKRRRLDSQAQAPPDKQLREKGPDAVKHMTDDEVIEYINRIGEVEDKARARILVSNAIKRLIEEDKEKSSALRISKKTADLLKGDLKKNSAMRKLFEEHSGEGDNTTPLREVVTAYWNHINSKGKNENRGFGVNNQRSIAPKGSISHFPQHTLPQAGEKVIYQPRNDYKKGNKISQNDPHNLLN